MPLSEQSRFAVWREYMGRTGILGAITKQQLRAAVDAIDSYMDTRAIDYNSALPAAGQALDATGKALVFAHALGARLATEVAAAPDAASADDLRSLAVSTILTLAIPIATADIHATIAASLAWLESEKVAFNAAISQPARSVLTAVQKARLMRAIAMRRYGG